MFEINASDTNKSLFVYYSSVDMLLRKVTHHTNTKIISGPNSKGHYFAQKMSHEH